MPGLNLGPRHARFAHRRPGRQDPRRQRASSRRCSDAERRPRARAYSRPARGQRRGAVDRHRPAHRRRGHFALSAQPRAAHPHSSCARCAPTAPLAHVEGWTKTSRPVPPLPAASVRALAMVQRPGFDFDTAPRYLQVTRPLPPAVVANALAVQEANREYRERALAREGLRRMYIGTLTLSLFLAVFGAVLLAVLFGNQLARPAARAGRWRAPGGRRRPAAHRRACRARTSSAASRARSPS